MKVDKPPHLLEAGEYSKHEGIWYACCPEDDLLANLARHDVVEHEDGTITVSPSIECTGGSKLNRLRWHGHLKAGVWTRYKD